MRHQQLFASITSLIDESQHVMNELRRQGFAECDLYSYLRQKIRRLEGMRLAINHPENQAPKLDFSDVENLYLHLKFEIQLSCQNWKKIKGIAADESQFLSPTPLHSN